MKGILWKWTNYWNGWQPRWFVLENGILSYYQSEENVSQGCKGSVSLTACNINVHPTDNIRLDIVIPGEQHIYVRAASTPERQQWLVALGTEKAQSLDSRKMLNSESSPDAIKTKKSELRLYCDLLMQQVHSIKEAATEEQGPNVPKLDECTSLLSATCETFIKTLEDCVRITDAATPMLPVPSHQHLPVVPTINASVSRSGANGSTTSKERLKSLTHSHSNSS